MNFISRRKFIRITGITAAGLALSPYVYSYPTAKNKIRAIAFDAFPVFDPRPVFRKVNELFPEKGKQLIEVWRTKQFSYQWLRATGNKYKNFWEVTNDALLYAAAECDLSLSESDVATIMDEYKTINVWPDVNIGLQQLKDYGLTLCFLSNMTVEMLSAGIGNSQTKAYFEHIISTDKIKSYKPDPAAYQLGVNILKLKKEEILFVAFAGWDVAGAKWFGYPTYWLNRLNSPAEKLDAHADGIGTTLTELIEFVKKYNEEK